jgi:hypothetical protein
MTNRQRPSGVRAARLSRRDHEELVSRFGRSEQPPLPHWEGNDFVLPQLSKEDAQAVLARHARDYGSDPRVPSRRGLVDVAALAASMAARVARGGGR